MNASDAIKMHSNCAKGESEKNSNSSSGEANNVESTKNNSKKITHDEMQT